MYRSRSFVRGLSVTAVSALLETHEAACWRWRRSKLAEEALSFASGSERAAPALHEASSTLCR